MKGDVVLPGYTVMSRLGSESSAMWLAREDATGEPVTLRFIAAPDPQVRERLVAALPILREVDHPHIAPLFDVVETPQGYVAVLGAADGGSLSAMVTQHGTLTFGQVVTACAPTAEGLAELHPHGIVHGAITLDDIVFTLDGRPMVVGVGLLQAGAELPTARGSLAVEVISGAPPSPKSDTYSMATVAVVAMTGYLPQRPLAIGGLPPAVQAVLERSLDHPPARPDIGVLANSLYTIADPEPVELAAEEVEGTGTMPTVKEPLAGSVPVSDPAPAGDIASYMRESVPGRRARRSTEPADANAEASTSESAAVSDAPTSRRAARPAERRRGDAESGRGGGRRAGKSRKDGAWVAIALAAVLLAVGGFFFLSDDDPLPGAEVGNPGGTAEAPVDLCGGPQPAPTAAPPTVTDWTQEVQRLYELRAQAFNEVNAELLCQVYAPTSTGLAADAELLQTYADEGVRTENLSFEVITAEVVSQNPGQVILSITDRQPEYTLVDDDGNLVETKAAMGDETWEAELIPVADEGATAPTWRLG